MLLLLASVQPTAAQGARFFRVSGPAASKITAFRSDGTIIWTNSRMGANYTVQTLAALPGGTNWVDYVQLHATNRINTNQIIDFNPPAGIALVAEGLFTLGPDGINAAYDTGLNPYTSPVGSFAANGYGLYDMAGNIWEWCWDWHGPSYTAGSDPRGPTPGTYRVLRGGDWYYYADYARCANRGYNYASIVTDHDGFRCVRGL